MKLWQIALVFPGVISCVQQETAKPQFHADENPASLSAWAQVLVDEDALQLSENVVPYDLNTPLFTDYAHKLRTVWLPDGTTASYSENEAFDFPVGTVISKTFYYPVADQAAPDQVMQESQGDLFDGEVLSLKNVRLLETRILAHRESGWVALPYVWNDAQSDATLMRAGDIKQLTLTHGDGTSASFSYIVPDANQCAGCHATNNTTRKIQPIGPKTRHLNREFTYASGTQNQLEHWRTMDILTGVPDASEVPQNAVWTDESEPLEARARAYLDANCSHCHNNVGPADTSGLYLEPTDPIGANYGICKLPIAAGTGTGGRRFGIVPGEPDKSIFMYRLESDNPAEMMPELGRSLVHDEGVALIRNWINQLDGDCDTSL